jgi:hypothetical protein
VREAPKAAGSLRTHHPRTSGRVVRVGAGVGVVCSGLLAVRGLRGMFTPARNGRLQRFPPLGETSVELVKGGSGKPYFMVHHTHARS